MRGIIKWYSPEKGFGWITIDGGEEVYVSAGALAAGPFEAGARVELKVIEGPAGKQALRVSAAADGPPRPRRRRTRAP